MFLRKQHARGTFRYPVRLGQVPSAAGYHTFEGYLAAAYPVPWPAGTTVARTGDNYILGYPGATNEGEDRVVSIVLSPTEWQPYWVAWLAAMLSPAPPPAPTTPGAELAQILSVAPSTVSPAADAVFTLQVTVANAGSITWSTGYSVRVTAPAGTPTTAPLAVGTMPGGIAPGQSATVTVMGTAPSQPGTYSYTVSVANPSSQVISALGTITVSVTAAAAAAAWTYDPTTGLYYNASTGQYYNPATGQYTTTPSTAAVQYPPAPSATGPAGLTYDPTTGEYYDAATYQGIPGTPVLSPALQQAATQPVVIQPTAPAGMPWWLWGVGLALLGGGVYYFFLTPVARRRRASGPTGQGMRPAAPSRRRPRRRTRR